MPVSSDGLGPKEVDAYLNRLGIPPASVGDPDRSTLTRLQRAHVTTVPFETLSITGDPYGERAGEGVVLSIPHLFDKIVERGRGGYCFELNGLFYALLIALGYDADRIAARVVSDGALRTPANHHPLVVELDRRYVVDVGTGPPMIRCPLPITGDAQTDEVGVTWRVTGSDRSDVTYRTEYRDSDETEWTPRYVFDDVARPFHYYEAANDYLQTAPESPFTGDPFVALSTDAGYRTLSDDTFTDVTSAGRHERTVKDEAWHDTLGQRFGVSYTSD